MIAPRATDLTPVERLQASRVHLRVVLLEAPHHPPSVLESLIKAVAADQPLKLSGFAALLVALTLATRPWREKAITPAWLTWISIAVTAWAKTHSRTS